jgi:hypothetical protein
MDFTGEVYGHADITWTWNIENKVHKYLNKTECAKKYIFPVKMGGGALVSVPS